MGKPEKYVGCLVFNRDEQVLLQSQETKKDIVWSLPMTPVKPDEPVKWTATSAVLECCDIHSMRMQRILGNYDTSVFPRVRRVTLISALTEQTNVDALEKERPVWFVNYKKVGDWVSDGNDNPALRELLLEEIARMRKIYKRWQRREERAFEFRVFHGEAG